VEPITCGRDGWPATPETSLLMPGAALSGPGVCAALALLQRLRRRAMCPWRPGLQAMRTGSPCRSRCHLIAALARASTAAGRCGLLDGLV